MRKMVLSLVTGILIASTVGFAEDADVVPTSPENPGAAAPNSPGMDAAKPSGQDKKAEREPARRRHKKKRRKHRRHH